MKYENLINVVVGIDRELGRGFCTLAELKKSAKTGLVKVSINGRTHIAKRNNVRIIPAYDIDDYLKLIK